MKYFFTMSLTLLFLSWASGQRLGSSAFTSFSGQETRATHTLMSSSGEVIDSRDEYDAHIVHNGLLQNLAIDAFYDSYIQVRYFLDENQNGTKDTDEIFLQLGAFTLNSLDTYINYSRRGTVIRTSSGNYRVQYTDVGADNWKLTTTDVAEITIDDQNKTGEVQFGLTAIDQITEVRAYLSSTRFRCFAPSTYTITVQNSGTYIENDVVYVKLDDRIEDIFFTETPDIVVSDHEAGWNFNLGPTESREIEFGINVPSVGNVNFPGDIFTTTTWIGSAADSTELVYHETLLCSYDPNDKLVNPDRPDGLSLLGDAITYTIRFQNTGNDYAENVVVTDTLSEHLDMSTFKLINTSHPDQLEVLSNRDNNRILNFTFNNIFLPDSTTNEAGSNGYIMYSIEPMEGLAEETEIENTAHIYFDFNPAVVTNTTSTTLVEQFPVDNTNSISIEEKILVFPNPTRGMLYIDKIVDELRLYDLYGKMVTDKSNTDQVDISEMDAGTYLMEISYGKETSIEKIILLK